MDASAQSKPASGAQTTRYDIGLQLYSVREAFESDPDATLARIAGLGITIVEPYTFIGQAETLRAALDRHGLSAPIAHANLLSDTIAYAGHTVPLPPVEYVLAEAVRLGATTVIDPIVPAERWRDEADVVATAERLNAAARLAAPLGVTVGYHNHTFEFGHRIHDLSAYEYFASLLDPGVVVELDLFWAAVAGQDLPALVTRLGDRVQAVHVKDGRIGADPFATGTPGYDETALQQVVAGTGDVDIAGALAAAHALRFAVIEFDRFDGDIFPAIEQTARSIRS